MRHRLLKLAAATLMIGLVAANTETIVNSIDGLRTYSVLHTDIDFNAEARTIKVSSVTKKNWSCDISDPRDPFVHLIREREDGRTRHEFYTPFRDDGTPMGGSTKMSAGDVNEEFNFTFMIPKKMSTKLVVDESVALPAGDPLKLVDLNLFDDIISFELVVPCERPFLGVVNNVAVRFDAGQELTQQSDLHRK